MMMILMKLIKNINVLWLMCVVVECRIQAKQKNRQSFFGPFFSKIPVDLEMCGRIFKNYMAVVVNKDAVAMHPVTMFLLPIDHVHWMQ